MVIWLVGYLVDWLIGWLVNCLYVFGWLDSFVVFIRNTGGRGLNLARYSKKRGGWFVGDMKVGVSLVLVDAFGGLLEGIRKCIGF